MPLIRAPKAQDFFYMIKMQSLWHRTKLSSHNIIPNQGRECVVDPCGITGLLIHALGWMWGHLAVENEVAEMIGICAEVCCEILIASGLAGCVDCGNCCGEGACLDLSMIGKGVGWCIC